MVVALTLKNDGPSPLGCPSSVVGSSVRSCALDDNGRLPPRPEALCSEPVATPVAESTIDQVTAWNIYKIVYSGFLGELNKLRRPLKRLVGPPGFEPGTSWTPTQ